MACTMDRQLSTKLFVVLFSFRRYMFGFSAVLAVVQAVGMAFLPPSPRFFVLRGKKEQVGHIDLIQVSGLLLGLQRYVF